MRGRGEKVCVCTPFITRGFVTRGGSESELPRSWQEEVKEGVSERQLDSREDGGGARSGLEGARHPIHIYSQGQNVTQRTIIFRGPSHCK